MQVSHVAGRRPRRCKTCVPAAPPPPTAPYVQWLTQPQAMCDGCTTLTPSQCSDALYCVVKRLLVPLPWQLAADDPETRAMQMTATRMLASGVGITPTHEAYLSATFPRRWTSWRQRLAHAASTSGAIQAAAWERRRTALMAWHTVWR